MFVLDLVNSYLRLKNYILPDGRMKLAFFNNGFHIYNGSYWKPTEEKTIRNEFIVLIKDKRIAVGEKFNFNNVEDCIRALEALTTVEELKTGSYIDTETPSNCHMIPVKNGILRVESDHGELRTTLEPHSHKFIASYALPYDFDQRARCPIWINFLNEVLPPEEISLLQEWFGYQLVPVTLAQKFMILNGSGANGKSVVCLILRLMLGNENVSAVPLQGFLSNDRFSLAATVNKLANIVTETDELKTFPTGRIKSFSVGEEFTIERKFKDAYLVKPTARLTFATNSLPPFRDKSDGIWRRLLLINFMVQILDESKQDKRLVDEVYWLELGELSGILNWALEGLKRLMSNSWKFSIPITVIKAMVDYSRELNPTTDFLTDFVEIHHRGEYHTATLYTTYVDYWGRSGFHPDNKIVFGKAVSRHFRGYIKQSKHSKIENGLPARVWLGICPKKHISWDVTKEELAHLDSLKAITQDAQNTQIDSINLISTPKLAETLKGSPEVVFESDSKRALKYE